MADHAHHDEHDHSAPKPVHMDHADDDRRITYFANTHTRGKREMFGIRAVDRGKHIYVIGKTGMGKSTMLENLAIQDIQNGEGIAFIDPHGSTAEKLLDFIPQERINDVIYFCKKLAMILQILGEFKTKGKKSFYEFCYVSRSTNYIFCKMLCSHCLNIPVRLSWT